MGGLPMGCGRPVWRGGLRPGERSSTLAAPGVGPVPALACRPAHAP
jgi:hypothetical protein